MALHSTLCFLLLSSGILLTRQDHGLLAIVTSDAAGGVMARRLLPAAILIPLLLGWVTVLDEEAGLHGPAFGVFLVVIWSIVSFAALTWWNSGSLYRLDVERQRAQDELNKGQAQLAEAQRIENALRQRRMRTRSLIATANAAFVAIDAGDVIKDWNPQAELTFGWKREEAVGRTLADTVIPPGHREAHLEGLHRFVLTGEGPMLNRRVELEGLHKDGHLFPIEMTISPIRWGRSHIFSAYVRAIT